MKKFMEDMGNEPVVAIGLLLTNEDGPAKQLSWLIRGFFCNVCNHNLPGTVRRAEALAVVRRMIDGAHNNGTIGFEDYKQIADEIDTIEASIYPGCSLI